MSIIHEASFTEGKKNTAISYLYRDGNNYKQHDVVVLEGALTLDEALEIVRSYENNEEGFVPSAVGLDDLQERMIDGWDDHPYHEIEQIGLTNREATTPITSDHFKTTFLETDWEKAAEKVSLEHQQFVLAAGLRTDTKARHYNKAQTLPTSPYQNRKIHIQNGAVAHREMQKPDVYKM